MTQGTPRDESRIAQIEREKNTKPTPKGPSLWQRFKVKLFGGEGTVRDLFR